MLKLCGREAVWKRRTRDYCSRTLLNETVLASTDLPTGALIKPEPLDLGRKGWMLVDCSQVVARCVCVLPRTIVSRIPDVEITAWYAWDCSS
jgi:hypothetical protein